MITTNIKVSTLARILGLFQEPLRLRLFLLLVNLGVGGKELCVSELAERLGSSISNTSHQLRKLEFAEIVDRIRHGRMICYRFRKTPFNIKLYNFLRSNIDSL